VKVGHLPGISIGYQTEHGSPGKALYDIQAHSFMKIKQCEVSSLTFLEHTSMQVAAVRARPRGRPTLKRATTHHRRQGPLVIDAEARRKGCGG
jgi:hypothetical protein